jgi:hypothetical protein
MLSAVTIMAIMVVDVELGTLATLMATPQMAIYFRKKAGTKDGLGVRVVLLENILSGMKIIHGMVSLFVKIVTQGKSLMQDHQHAQIAQ